MAFELMDIGNPLPRCPLHHAHGDAVDGLQNLAVHDLRRRAIGHHLARFQGYQPVAEAGGQIDIVQYHNHGQFSLAGKALQWVDKPAAFVDHWTRRRLPWLVSGARQYLMALICMAVAAAMPLMELIPFSANGGGLALMAFGLSIVARDGLLALVAVATTGGTGWFVLTNLPW